LLARLNADEASANHEVDVLALAHAEDFQQPLRGSTPTPRAADRPALALPRCRPCTFVS
jgi:hypothetical protein